MVSGPLARRDPNARTAAWQGKETTYDEMLCPHQRSIDQLCFSEQYYFVVVLCSLGTLCWMLGLQIIFTNRWNIFNDPGSPIVLFVGLVACKAGRWLVSASSAFLKIWVIRLDDLRIYSQSSIAQILDRRGTGSSHAQAAFGLLAAARGAPPKPPRGSAHEGWPEPMPYDAKGMERYRRAFLAENQQWLQAMFSELRDKTTMTQNREALLRSFAGILGEMPPSQYAPSGGDTGAGVGGFDADQLGSDLAFGQPPPQALARAVGSLQRQSYQGTVAHQVIRMWRQRAQFMLHLERMSSMVKIEHQGRADRCELCGNTRQLHVTPIYTMTHLASTYRQQRDMSPLWNTPLWQHFYQRTPMCTLCDEHFRQYRTANTNIPVDEYRFRRLEEQKATPYRIVMESDFPVAPIEADAVKLLWLWYHWTKDLAAGEAPQEFLPRYGVEGRTPAEIRQMQHHALAAEAADKESLPSLSESEKEEASPAPASGRGQEGASRGRRSQLVADPKSGHLGIRRSMRALLGTLCLACSGVGKEAEPWGPEPAARRVSARASYASQVAGLRAGVWRPSGLCTSPVERLDGDAHPPPLWLHPRPQVVEPEDEDSDDTKKRKAIAKAKAKALARAAEESDDDGAQEGGAAAFRGLPEVSLAWSDRAVLLGWLARARESLQAPHTRGWARPSTLPPRHQPTSPSSRSLRSGGSDLPAL